MLIYTNNKLPGLKFLFILSGLLIFLLSCQSSLEVPIPGGDIIYMNGNLYELGFIQPDGENNQNYEIEKRLAQPTWSSDGNVIFGLSGSFQAGYYLGHPAYWDLEIGLFRVCSGNFHFYEQIQGSGNPNNPYEVIVHAVWDIAVFDLSKCKITKTLVDYSANPEKYYISGFSYSPDNQKLLYGLILNPYADPETERKYQLVQLNLKTGDQETIAEGINPAWSPDGTQIAYVGLDGLYVMNTISYDTKMLISHPLFDPWRIIAPETKIPFPKWSPDGKSLVYHYCSKPFPCKTEDTQIFTISSVGGKEVLIHSGGEYPSWGSR
jgi:hypothetical protein